VERQKQSNAANPIPKDNFTVVMKFGGSSLASAERIREVADLILSFPDENPVVVLSAMGKTTNNLLNVCIRSFSIFFLIFSNNHKNCFDFS